MNTSVLLHTARQTEWKRTFDLRSQEFCKEAIKSQKIDEPALEQLHIRSYMYRNRDGTCINFPAYHYESLLLLYFYY